MLQRNGEDKFRTPKDSWTVLREGQLTANQENKSIPAVNVGK